MLADLIENSFLRNEFEGNALRPSIESVLDKLREFEAEADEDYLAAFEMHKFKKGEIILEEGEVPTRFWFLKSGLARLFSIRNGEQVTADFFFSSEFIDLYGSSALQQPSHGTIQLMMDSELYSIKWDVLERLKASYSILHTLEKIVVGCYMRTLELRVFEMNSMSASERYQQLVNAHPYILQQVPVTNIASYLGVKVETLSRIRKKLAQS